MRRTLLGMSQEKLGEAIGLTFQQVQKYERGSNRISAGTLYRLSQVLNIPVSFFFDAYDDPHAADRPRSTDEPPYEEGVISRREARLLRLWRSATPSVTDEILALLSALSPHLRDPQEEDGAAPITVAPPPKPVRSDAKSSGGGRQTRRRPGAVWDPTDILRAAKGRDRT